MLRLGSSRVLRSMAAPRMPINMALRSMLFQQRPMIMCASLLRPSLMQFSVRNFNSTAAADTPGSLMQDSTPLENKFRRFFGQDLGEHSTLWLCALIEDCFLRRPLTFD